MDQYSTPSQLVALLSLVGGFIVLGTLWLVGVEVSKKLFDLVTPKRAARERAFKAHPRGHELFMLRGHLRFAEHMTRATRNNGYRTIGEHYFYIEDVAKTKVSIRELEQIIKEEVNA